MMTEPLQTFKPLCFTFGSFCLSSYLSIFAIVKNEAPYLSEWIEYHLIVGVNKFWLVDNDSEDHPEEFLAPYISEGLVNFTQWPGSTQQLAVYNTLIPLLREQTFWVAIIDLDEFLVPIAGRSVPDILAKLQGLPGIALNEVVHGANGQLRKRPGLVIERFKNHTVWDHQENHLTKVIADPRQLLKCEIHDHSYANQRPSYNALGERNTEYFLWRETCPWRSQDSPLLVEVTRRVYRQTHTRSGRSRGFSNNAGYAQFDRQGSGITARRHY
jgi:hypothetical protein